MPAGTEGFQGRRLTMAREARGMKQNELAAAIGRTDPTISKWEGGSKTPDPSAINDLSAALKVANTWFFLPISEDNNAVFYRSMSSELQLMRKRARARLGFVEAIEVALSEYVTFPEVDVPDLVGNVDFLDVRQEELEVIAEDLRSHWQIGRGPLENIVLLMENSGIIVAEDTLGSVKLDGVSWWSSRTEKPYVLLAQDKKSGVRRRFDAAHELAHLIVHRRVTPKQLEDHFKFIEDQAMNLAGALLMPAKEFKRSVFTVSLDGLVAIKEEWGVSVGAMIKRLANLGELSAFNERRLWQYYSARRWKTREPLDEKIEIESPENLKICVEDLDTQGDLSRFELLQTTGLSSDDISILCGMPEGYFALHDMPLQRIRPKLRLVDDEDGRTEGENVVTFPGGRR